ncbi:hypothetical protein NP233_g1624 [Leucocoprinus birnbaumii]|uniref:Amidohydrolase 3 domain-containing protein n=1 Tax=Leucocoprinus birnbaumii TaxID=56174 RepID=A0AAD5VZN6_9AGAR|nr:hypothetical protein NP233_g1624 [Leucocoprinus birnbaumii]
MPPQESSDLDAKANGGLNGHSNGSAELKSPGKSGGANLHSPPVAKNPKAFSGRFNTLFVFALLGTIWATFHSFNFGSNSYALCSRDGEGIYTVDEHNSKMQCVVVQEARIVDIGSISDINERWQRDQSIFTRLLTRNSLSIKYLPSGAILVPGVTDTVLRVREFILNNPDILNDKTKWIRGGGWDHTIWPSSNWPTSAELDADPIIRGRPVVLQSKDCHALWVSAEAIRLSSPFPDSVEGGVIVRGEDGEPTGPCLHSPLPLQSADCRLISGVFLDNAQDLIKQPGLTEDDLLRRFKLAVDHAHSRGLTSIHDAGLDPMSLAFFKKQAEIGVLPIRIYGMTYFNEHQPYWGNTSQIIIGKDDYRLTARSVKIFADGALRTGGAALYEPYHDNPGTSGFMRLDPEILFDVIPKYLRDGWQVNVHAIGDRANGIVLDAFEASLQGANVTALRPRLEHAQMMTRADMKRLGKLGVIASVQPTHAISDMWYAEDRLGPERVKLLYAFRSVVDNGARITLGSDFPVESMNPLSAFYAAVTRVSPDGKSPHGPGGWFPEERLTRVEALRGMTIDPAYASFTEDILGSIEVGKRADFTIFSQDIMSVPADTILDTKVIATVIDGKTIFGQL